MTTSMSAAALRAHVGRLPRFPLAHLPTPLEPLPRFSQSLGGPQIYIKRDDCTGLALGGNKTRHNEFLIAEALQRQADLVVWGAGVQSNNCRQTAAACAKAGLECHLLLSRGNHAGMVPVQGNLLLDHLLGASYEVVDATIGTDLDRHIDSSAEGFRKAGRRVFAWDRDTVQPLAAVSYLLCLAEILEQAGELQFTPDAVYVCSSGATGAGLALGARALGQDFAVRSICPIRWEWDTQAEMVDVANRAAEMIGIGSRLVGNDISVTFDYVGPGYGQASAECLEAMALLARTEGILLDPVYTSKALAGLIDHIRHQRLTEEQKVVFVHTGGTPAVFAYHEELTRSIAARSLAD